MASIYQRNGKFYGSFKEGGRWVRRLLGETRAEAERRLDEILEGDYRPPTPARFHFPTAVNSYLKKIRVYAKIASVQVARSSCRLLLDHFGQHEFSKEGMEKFIERRRREVSARSVNRDLIILRAILRHAVEERMLPEMPFKVTMLRAPKKRVLRILSKEEMRLLIGTAKHPYRGILLIAANTGFRLDEILHLTWDDVFWSERRIVIRGKDGWSPKSYQERSCFVSEEVIDYLHRHRNTSKWLFPNKWGRVRAVVRTCMDIREVFVRAGIYQKGTPLTHLIRHSVCSHLLGNGVDIETVRTVMGHASLQTTQGYAHTSDDRMRKANQALPW